MSVQPVYAGMNCGSGGGCPGATFFAPGQLAITSDSPANTFAPGHQHPPTPIHEGASDFAPGIEKQTTTGTVP